MKTFTFLCILLTFTGFSPAFAQKAKQEQIYKCAGVGDAAPRYQTTKCEGDPDSQPLKSGVMPTAKEMAAQTRGKKVCESELIKLLPKISMMGTEWLELAHVNVGLKSEVELPTKTVESLSFRVILRRTGQDGSRPPDGTMYCHTTPDGRRYLSLEAS